jgi:hypothetical protein
LSKDLNKSDWHTPTQTELDWNVSSQIFTLLSYNTRSITSWAHCILTTFRTHPYLFSKTNTYVTSCRVRSQPAKFLNQSYPDASRSGPSKVTPPSTISVWPVMYRALSDAKNRTALPTSQPVPSIPKTEARTLASRAFSLIPD